MQQQQPSKESVLTIEQQKRITFSGVESVDAFSQTCILLTVLGKKVRIEGTNLKVLSFSQGSGNFAASGEVSLVRFGGARGKVLSRLFK